MTNSMCAGARGAQAGIGAGVRSILYGILLLNLWWGTVLGVTPPGWNSVDLGYATGGSASQSGGVYTVNGAGIDVWGVADYGQFLYQTLNGDGTIIAQVNSIQPTDPWAKAGVMIRATTATDSQNAFMLLSSGNGFSFQNRAGQGATTTAILAQGYAAPGWVKLQRTGNTFVGSYSVNGSTWTPVNSVTITMATQVLVGLAVTSHTNNSTFNQSTFSNVSITGAPGATGVLTPYAWGPVTAGAVDHFGHAFDGAPIWNGSAPTAPTDANGDHYITAAWDQLQTVYIDLGVGWRTWRIQQAWTQYLVGRSGAGTPYSNVWWDNVKNTAPAGTSIAEPLINFASQTHDATGAWVRDGSFAAPITPKGRYLMLRTAYPTDQACEYAFIGYRDFSGANYPPEVSAGANQSVQWAARLQGTVSDDGLPNPPGAISSTWTMVSGPSGGVAAFTTPTALTTEVSVSVPGAYQFRLTANDNGTVGLSANATVSVTFAHASTTPTLAELKAFNYSSLVLVDEVNCGNPADPHQADLVESPAGSSQYQTILGRACRVLPNPVGAPSRYFAYRLGAGKNLQANKAYVLVVEYPEDKPRQITVLNRGCETTRTIHTGITVGDALAGQYTPGNANSMHFALSQQYRTAETLFHLHTNYPGLIQPRDDEVARDNHPAGGFLVMISHFRQASSLLSEGAAVARIALYEAPALASYTQPLTLPPNNLPKRHLFWREEMADGLLGDRHGVDNDMDWYEWKAQLAKFLGMNTFSTDLLEFGYNQGFSSAKYNGIFGPGSKWQQILYRLTRPHPEVGLPNGYGLDFLPYYEYAGSNSGGNGSLGPLKAALPLVGINNGHDYTGVYWAEGMDVDITDTQLGVDAQGINHPYTDAVQMLDATITDLSAGGFPILIDQPYNIIDPGGVNAWGYVDFGPNYANYRITQTWTRSTPYASDPARPYGTMYWNNSYTGFTGATPPAGSIAETNINFVTKAPFGGESAWKRDMNKTTANPVIPPARYLMMRSPAALSRVSQYLFVGWINGSGSTTLQTLPIAGSGPTNTTWPYHDLRPMFNNQPPFNSSTASFVGAWFRTRPTEIPMSFADAALARFATQANGGVTVTRPQLQASATLMNSYTAWWMNKRKDFLNYLRDYLRGYDPQSVVLYTWDATEEGAHPISPTGEVIADDPGLWTGLVSTTDYQTAISSHLQLSSLLAPRGIYPNGNGQEEYTYSMPPPDPVNYQNNTGVMMTHTFNKPYTVSDPASWTQFRTQSGIAAIRHYCLNEDCMPTASGDIRALLGYFVSDVDPAGPYVMLSETRAVAYGDPYYIGYLSSNSFNRCSPAYVRDFNANYLALPAMPSTVVVAASDAEVIVRAITTPSNGTWVAIANTSLNEKLNVQITPPVTGTVTDAVTGAAVPLVGGKIILNMWPGRLKSVKIQ